MQIPWAGSCRVLLVAAGLLIAGAAQAQLSRYSDPEVERCLTEGKIGKRAGRLVGVTKPEHLEIDCAIGIESIVFKTLDEHRRGITRLGGGATEMNFSDSYKYERAAYLLDRELGLEMVPVAVIRNIGGDEGALIAWIPNAGHEARMEGRPTGPQMAALAQQKAVMRLFDALILNVDRRQDNWMIDRDSWRLYLIDHSRAFRERSELPPEFENQRVRLSRDLHARLSGLDEDRLRQLLAGLISGAQLEALLARRDLILQKIDRDRSDYGDEVIYTDWVAESSPDPAPSGPR